MKAMNYKIWILVVGLLIPVSLFSQKSKFKDDSKFVYVSNVSFSSGVGPLNFDGREMSNNLPNFGVQQVIAYQFNAHFFMGIGAGVSAWKKSTQIPLFLNMSVSFIDRKVSPHWNLNLGYSFKWYTDSRPDLQNRLRHAATPGLYGESGLGVKFNANDKVSLLLLVNYSLQQSTIEYTKNDGNSIDMSHQFTNASAFMLYHFVGVKFAIQY